MDTKLNIPSGIELVGIDDNNILHVYSENNVKSYDLTKIISDLSIINKHIFRLPNRCFLITIQFNNILNQTLFILFDIKDSNFKLIHTITGHYDILKHPKINSVFFLNGAQFNMKDNYYMKIVNNQVKLHKIDSPTITFSADNDNIIYYNKDDKYVKHDIENDIITPLMQRSHYDIVLNDTYFISNFNNIIRIYNRITNSNLDTIISSKVNLYYLNRRFYRDNILYIFINNYIVTIENGIILNITNYNKHSIVDFEILKPSDYIILSYDSISWNKNILGNNEIELPDVNIFSICTDLYNEEYLRKVKNTLDINHNLANIIVSYL